MHTMITSAEGRFTESRRGGLGRNELFSLQPLSRWALKHSQRRNGLAKSAGQYCIQDKEGSEEARIHEQRPKFVSRAKRAQATPHNMLRHCIGFDLPSSGVFQISRFWSCVSQIKIRRTKSNFSL